MTDKRERDPNMRKIIIITDEYGEAERITTDKDVTLNVSTRGAGANTIIQFPDGKGVKSDPGRDAEHRKDLIRYLESVVNYLHYKRENPHRTASDENWLLEGGEMYLRMLRGE